MPQACPAWHGIHRLDQAKENTAFKALHSCKSDAVQRSHYYQCQLRLFNLLRTLLCFQDKTRQKLECSCNNHGPTVRPFKLPSIVQEASETLTQSNVVCASCAPCSLHPWRITFPCPLPMLTYSTLRCQVALSCLQSLGYGRALTSAELAGVM